MNPGVMQFTVIPCAPASTASPRVNPTSPPLLAMYATSSGYPIQNVAEEMFTIRP